jgi:dephospho-CoA kinase
MATKRVALTGGIATGKSHCLKLFHDAGVPTLDADQLAHAAVEPGTGGHRAVVERFGAGIVDSGGAIDRRALARIVFADPKARRDLETIVHPRVYRAIGEWFAVLGDRGAPIGIADIPLLFETGREIDYDAVIVTSCPAEMQIERLMARGRMTRKEAQERLAAQLPTAAKVARADYVIDTSGSFEETDRQITAVLEALRQ